ERGEARVEVALDRGQRDVHDRVVEHDHEQREAHGAERPPAAVGRARRKGADLLGHLVVLLGMQAATSSRDTMGASARARFSCSWVVKVAMKVSMPARRAALRLATTASPVSVMAICFWRR